MRTIQIRLTEGLVRKAQALVNQGLYSNKSEVIRDSLRRLCFPQTITNERKFGVIYTSDIHGNMIQYKKLFDEAIKVKADSIIIGGDLLPKDKKNRTPDKQRKFLEKELIPLMQKFHRKNKEINKNSCPIFVMLGNDDFKKNLAVLKRNEKKGGYKVIQGKCLSFFEEFKIIGYPYVPLTPFVYKDWEKLDLNVETETKNRTDFILGGKVNNHSKKDFNLSNRKDTIEKDLIRLLRGVNPDKLILVTHSPPHNTSLDMTSKLEHVGSEAVRKIIEEEKPLISLHGHIHETVNFSGDFIQNIDKTISITSGNDNLSKKLSLIEFNLYEPEKAKRVLI